MLAMLTQWPHELHNGLQVPALAKNLQALGGCQVAICCVALSGHQPFHLCWVQWLHGTAPFGFHRPTFLACCQDAVTKQSTCFASSVQHLSQCGPTFFFTTELQFGHVFPCPGNICPIHTWAGHWRQQVAVEHYVFGSQCIMGT